MNTIQNDRITDMTDLERDALERLTSVGNGDPIGPDLPEADPYVVIMYGWGPDDEIPYGQVLVCGRTGRRFIPIDHSTALVARARTAQQVVERVVAASPRPTGGTSEEVIAFDGSADRALILGVTAGDMTSSSQYAEHDRILLGRRVAQIAAALPSGYQVSGTRLIDGRYAIEVQHDGLDEPERRQATGTIATHLDISAAPQLVQHRIRRLLSALTDSADGNCPACESSGVTPEQARRTMPRYMAAVDAMDRDPEARYLRTPDEPAAWCWTCRQLLASGFDPVALSDLDAGVIHPPITPSEIRELWAGSQPPNGETAALCALAETGEVDVDLFQLDPSQRVSIGEMTQDQARARLAVRVSRMR